MPAVVAGVTRDSGTTGPATPHRWKIRRWAVPAIRIGVAVVIAAAIAWTTIRQWPGVHSAMAKLAWPSLVLALVAALLGMFAGMMAWRAALTDLGHRIPVRTAGRISLVGQLGKYVPGSVWAYVLQMELGRRAGLPRARALLASVVSVGLGVTAGLGVGVFALPALFTEARGAGAEKARLALYVVIVLVPIALCCAHPRVLTVLVRVFLRLARRQPLQHPLTWRGVLATIGWSVLAYVLFGVHLWLLANAQGEPGAGAVLRSVGAMGLAMTIAVFAVFLPSGLGVREFILVAALSPYLHPAGAALGIALASRMIFTVADLIAAGLAAISGLRALRRPVPVLPALEPLPLVAPPPDPAPAGTGPDRSTPQS